MRKLNLKRKILKPGAPAATHTISEATFSVEQSGAKHIRDLPTDQFDLVIECIRDGTSMADIASFFGSQGYLTVSEKTFTQYLGAFRRVYPDMIRGEDGNNLNHHASKRRPRLDEEQGLEQLARIQSIRIKRGVDFEVNTGMVNVHLHKDIRATREVYETLAKLRGKGGVGRPAESTNSNASSNEAKEGLRSLDQGEAAQDKLTSLFGQLAPLLKQRQNNG